MMPQEGRKQKLRLLALHSFRTSARIFKQQVSYEAHRYRPLTEGPMCMINIWHYGLTLSSHVMQFQQSGLVDETRDLVDVVFIDAPHPASGAIPRDVAPHFNGPFFEWFTVERMCVLRSPMSSYSSIIFGHAMCPLRRLSHPWQWGVRLTIHCSAEQR